MPPGVDGYPCQIGMAGTANKLVPATVNGLRTLYPPNFSCRSIDAQSSIATSQSAPVTRRKRVRASVNHVGSSAYPGWRKSEAWGERLARAVLAVGAAPTSTLVSFGGGGPAGNGDLLVCASPTRMSSGGGEFLGCAPPTRVSSAGEEFLGCGCGVPVRASSGEGEFLGESGSFKSVDGLVTGKSCWEGVFSRCDGGSSGRP